MQCKRCKRFLYYTGIINKIAIFNEFNYIYIGYGDYPLHLLQMQLVNDN